MEYKPGARVGDYEVVQVLGAGGMGKVYKVRNVLSDRVEAMKVLLPDLQKDQQLSDRFLREIKVQASLQHPNIASLHTALTVDNQLLMLMEFVEGESIEGLLERGPLAADQCMDYAIQALRALEYAHQRGIIHRDIKPPNIMVTTDGTVKLMDFGIAKVKADRKLTQTGMTVGSLYYMSPEQIKGDELDSRSDLYSFGITLYEMLTGKRPFEGGSDFQIMAAHLNQPPVPPAEINKSLPPALSEIIVTSIAKDPAQRFQSATAMANALSNVKNAGSAPAPTVMVPGMAAAPPPAPTAGVPAQAPAPPPPPQPVAVMPRRSNRALYMTLGALVAVAVLALAAFQLPKLLHPTTADTFKVVEQPQPSPVPTSAPVDVPRQERATQETVQQPVPQPVQQSVKTVEVAKPKPKPVVSSEEPATQNPPPVVAEQPKPTAEPQQAAPEPPKPDPQLAVLGDSLSKLDIRATTVRTKAQSIEEQQRRQGLGMRSDVTSGIMRMNMFLNKAEKLLASGDVEGARTAMKQADQEVEQLESKLGIY